MPLPPRGRVDFRCSRLHELGDPARARAAASAAQARSVLARPCFHGGVGLVADRLAQRRLGVLLEQASPSPCMRPSVRSWPCASKRVSDDMSGLIRSVARIKEQRMRAGT